MARVFGFGNPVAGGTTLAGRSVRWQLRHSEWAKISAYVRRWEAMNQEHP